MTSCIYSERCLLIKVLLFLQGHESQHNMSYWGGQQYIGIGPGLNIIFLPICGES